MTKNNFAMQETLKGDRVLQTNATRQLWARVGMSFYLTDAEYEKFCEFAEKETDELSIYIPELIKKGRAVLDGETYFPEDCNDNLDNRDIEVQLYDQMNFKGDVVHNLIDAMSEYALESGWTDRDFMDALIDCGVTKEDFVQAGHKEFVEKYFEEDQKERQETNTCEKQTDSFKVEETSIVDEEHSTSEKYHVVCNLYYQMDNDSLVIDEAKLNLQLLKGIDKESISIKIAEARDAENEEYQADKNYWIIAEFLISGEKESIRKEIEDVMGFMEVDDIVFDYIADQTSMDDTKECCEEQADDPDDFLKMIIELSLEHKEYAVKLKQLLDAYKYPTDKFFSGQAVNCLKTYTKIDQTVNGYAEIVDDIAYALYEEYNESEQSYDLTMKTLKEYSVLIDDNDDEEAFIESLKEKKNPLIELGDTQVTIATIVYRILSGEVKEYPVEEPMEITDSDAEKIEERFYSLKQRYIPLKELLEIAKNELS